MDSQVFSKTASLLVVPFLFGLLATGCDAESASAEAEATDRSATDDSEHEEDHAHSEQDHSHAGGEHEVHLGDMMYVLTRRFSAIWYAGQRGNQGMVDYQIHEIEETVEELESARPTENGVDVVGRLEADILPELEAAEQAVDDSDTEAFEESYRTAMDNCSSCHADVGHDYVNVKIPERNPYPNLEMAPQN